jgi:C-terminal processing protease CtpA/Prc
MLLVNEHTASAGEMVSAFAEENNLATIVGRKHAVVYSVAAHTRLATDTFLAFRLLPT